LELSFEATFQKGDDMVSLGKLNRSAKNRDRVSRAAKEGKGSEDEAIKAKIEELRHLEAKSFGPRHGRTDFYEYLKGVYNAWDWTDAKAAAEIGRQVAKLYKIKTRENKIAMRIVIDATSNQHYKVKSKWLQVLDYAVAKRARGEAFKNFVKRNDGVSGCAQKMAELRRKGISRKGKTGRKRDESDDWD
jgi:hypothetical protein